MLYISLAPGADGVEGRQDLYFLLELQLGSVEIKKKKAKKKSEEMAS